jgi:hypothetical protein
MSARTVKTTENRASSAAAYREQIAEYARCLATGSIDALRDAIEGDDCFDRMIAFIDGAYNKRADWLQSAVEFVAPAFDNLAELIDDYVNTAPPAAVGANVDDADAFLAWLEETQTLSPRQADFVACQRARHAVESQALGDRMAYLWYQEVASLASRFADELYSQEEAAHRLTIHVNPIHAWVRMQTTELLDQPTALPVEVVFFAVDEGIHTADFSTAAADLVRELHLRGPITFENWRRENSSINPIELKTLIVTLARLGLVAFT